MKTLLWLDDFRNPDIYPNIEIVNGLSIDGDIIWVKNYNQFIDRINKHGLPYVISFDHDLTVGRKPEYEKTGFDCAKWLIDYCIDNKLKLPVFYCHSQNPAGKENILRLLNNYKQHERKN